MLKLTKKNRGYVILTADEFEELAMANSISISALNIAESSLMFCEISDNKKNIAKTSSEAKLITRNAYDLLDKLRTKMFK